MSGRGLALLAGYNLGMLVNGGSCMFRSLGGPPWLDWFFAITSALLFWVLG